ncbi:MAG: arsenic resistance protein [Cereibacter sphaeroides]|uniref:Arsenic resistance protein n=1 Tax=Cereibacter sphaeroides TaxID=1063 RepID=A0A2W5SCR2_CERSP|nr:MAG: arsenic resistance protein [Cereibacter sphaeroides]
MHGFLERHQVWIYFGCVALGVGVASVISGTEHLEVTINPALAFMLFVTFLQVPLAKIGKSLREMRFLAALLTSNFIVIPVLAYLLSRLATDDALLRLGVLMVLLTPCIDYVITFAHLGRADARLLLASTPILLLVQMALLPIYLAVFLGRGAAELVSIGPFIHAFLWLIALPLVLAGAMQFWAVWSRIGRKVSDILGVLPVPATGLVLFLVVATIVPILGVATDQALAVLPLYIAFAIMAPLAGWLVSVGFGLRTEVGRAVAFSCGTRNSLVVLPLALAVPGAIPVLPAIIVTQTLVELVAELIYIRVIPKLAMRGRR